MSRKNESGKINIEVPEMALKLIKQKEVSEANKKNEEQERENKTIEAYASVLGWYTTEDGSVDVEKSKIGLIGLLNEYKFLEDMAQKDYQRRCMNRSGRGQPVPDSYFMCEERIGELLERSGVGKENTGGAKKIITAYNLLKSVFVDFNKFVEGLWESHTEIINNKHREAVGEWEKRRLAAAEARERFVESRVEIEIQARLEQLNLGFEKPKKKLPITEVREITRETGNKNPFIFEEEKPEVKVVNFEERIERERLDIAELESLLGKFVR